MLLTTVVPTHLDLEYSYLVFGTLRWPIEVDPLHPDQRSEFKHTSAPYTHTHTHRSVSQTYCSVAHFRRRDVIVKQDY